MNAALVGAKTVKVAEPSVLARFGSPPGAVVALVTAFTSESRPAATAVCTIFSTGGLSTLPILCITPFLASMFAWVTWIPFTKTPAALLVTNTESPLAVITLAFGPAGTCAANILEGMVWYNKMLLTCAGVSALSAASVMPDAVNAALSGAKTVKGPLPLSVAARFALITAVSSVLKFASATTRSVMVLDAGAGPGSSSSQDEKDAKAPNANNKGSFEIRWLIFILICFFVHLLNIGSKLWIYKSA